MKAIYKRELKAYFNNILGYIFCAFILLFIGIYTMAINLNGASANFEYAIGNMGFIYLIAVPIITMRAIAEERKQKTDQLLYSLPISMSEVVLGKFFCNVDGAFNSHADCGDISVDFIRLRQD